MAKIKVYGNNASATNDEVGVLDVHAGHDGMTLFASPNMDKWPFFELKLNTAEAEKLAEQLLESIKVTRRLATP